MRLTIVLLISVAVIGVFWGSLHQSQGPEDRTAVATSSISAAAIKPADRLPGVEEDVQLMALTKQLAEEIEARKALQLRVDTLSSQLSQLLHESPQAESASADSQLNAAEPSADSVWFNEQALIDAGIEVAEANRIKAVYEELALEQLYVRDQAIREGWDGATRREAFQVLEEKQQALQAELGEDSYDAYLYASGQPNRVQVQAVLAGSTADSVGIQNGDYIISYADQRVHNGRELRSATAQGTVDEMVAITINRDDTVQQVYIPRGPLGIRMSSASVAP